MDPSSDQFSALRSDLTALGEAAVLTCLRIQGPGAGFTLDVLDRYAQALSRLTTIYTVSADREYVRALVANEVQGGRFADGGRVLVFNDGRQSIGGLAVRRNELYAAIETLRRGNMPRD